MRQASHKALMLVRLLCITASFCAIGQAVAQSAAKDPLATKQQIVRDRMAQLEDRMFRLTQQLAETEPEQAARLQQALQRARELLISRNMDEAILLLDQGHLTDASDKQLSIEKDLQLLLKILLTDPDNTKERNEEIKRLEAFRKQVEELLKQQRAIKDRTDAAARPRDEKKEPFDHAKTADQQGKLGQKTDQLAKKMQGGQPGEGSKEGGQGPPKPPAPGTDNVARAGEHMKNAEKDLQRKSPPNASQDQQRAIDELERAQEELEQVLEQLRKEQQEEILRGLESRFRAMLAAQLTINKGTETLDAKDADAWRHADDLALAALAQDEKELARQAGEALHILKEDGTTIVFPRIVAQMQQDMRLVADRLNTRKTGQTTQQLEAEIVTTLEDLIEAIEQLRKQIDDGGSGGGGSGGDDIPLLPDSAELKLLRSLQHRVHRITKTFWKDNSQADEWDQQQKDQLARIAERQNDVAEMARKMHERVTGQ
jgi:hypothetical protein